MNCVKHNETVALDGVPANDHARFCADVANGLHALAQPLSILRAAVEMISVSEKTARRRYLDIAEQQMNRTSRLFTSLQNLVASELEPAHCTRFDLWELLAPMIEDRKPALRELGIAIAASKPDSAQPVFADAARTQQAICAILEIATSNSSPGDRIELKTSQSGGFVEFTVTGADSETRRMSSTDRLNLSVAKQSIVGQQGAFDFCEEPFRVSFTLPVSESGARASAENLCAASAD
jgi:signal transduction histidine kinase